MSELNDPTGRINDPPMTREKWPEMRMKHLELMQGVVARMGGNSAALKGYCMGIVAALIALAGAIEKPRVLFLGLPIVLVFSVLDAAYLTLEKGFRNHYDDLRKTPLDREPDFHIAVSRSPTLTAVYFTWSVVVFYGAAAAILALTALVI